MNTDAFSMYYATLMDGTYDGVDRIVLNAYFRLGQSPAGFRTWWRSLHDGSDEHLDNAHLVRMAGRFSRRLRAYASAHRIPILDCQSRERKHELAEQYLPKDPNFMGVFLILVSRAPAPVWEVQRGKSGAIKNIARKAPLPYVNHYWFHIIDAGWGHLTIKMCGHSPFTAQIILNGHEYVAREAVREGIGFRKEGNCFTEVADAARLAEVADTLCAQSIVRRLSRVCERWIYSACLCFALDLAAQQKSGFRYAYSVYQGEYSRNLLFTRGSELEEIFQGVIDRTRTQLNVKQLRTILGTKKRPSRRAGKSAPREEIVIKRPAYDMTVFKIHFGKITAKFYTKGERVLRIEVIFHNARALFCGHSLERFPEIIKRLSGILNWFLDAVRCVDIACIGEARLDEWPCASRVGRIRVGGVGINKPRMRAVIEAVIELAAAPRGFTVSDLAVRVTSISGSKDGAYTPR